MPRGYPVTLMVEDHRCLVVGGGPVAARKARSLLECSARVHVVAASMGPDMEALAAEFPDALTTEARPYRSGEAARYPLAFASARADHDDPDLDARVAADAAAAGVWCNVADDPVHSTFHVPALARRDPVAVAVSTEGASPALASWVRDQIAGGTLGPFGPEVGQLARLLSEQRDEIRAGGRSTESVDWRSVLDSGVLDLIRDGRLDLARERLQGCLS